LNPPECLEHKPELELENVTVTYSSGRTAMLALQDVSLQFEAGALTLVMGPSGSGKTTLLTVMGCLLSPQSGLVRVLGLEVNPLSEDERALLRRQHIGFVFQAYRLFRALSAIENVFIGLELSDNREKSRREAAWTALESVGLADKANLRPDQLSGGEKQRVAIARALVKQPLFVLADEPTASLDGKSGAQIAEILQGLARKQKKVVVAVTHDQRLAEFADRVVVLQDGRLIRNGGSRVSPD
jgi:putative ABC transport system ATP-binding protein